MENTNVNSIEKKSGGSTWIVGALLIIVLGFIAFRVIGRPSGTKAGEVAMATTETTPETSPSVSSTPSVSPTPEVKVDRTITVEGGNFSFSPKTIKVKKGEVIKIVFNNKEGFHDFIIDELNVNTGRIKENQTAEAVFTATKTGTFEYYCSVGAHRKMGMWGKITVE